MRRSLITLALAFSLATPAWAQLETFKDCDQCPEMVVIPAGDFVMGSQLGERGRNSDEGPAHRVTIRSAFALGKYEVTSGEFEAFVRETGYTVARGCDARSGTAKSWIAPGYARTARDPVVCVGWVDAKAYVNWLSRKTGFEYRLPSEAEWEYAARAGTVTARYWGQGIGSNRATCDGCGSPWDDQRPAPVGSFPANPFGLHDMLGNNWEWVEDCYHEGYAGAPSDGSVWLSGSCSKRVIRGGSWESSPRRLRAANRNRRPERKLDDDYGFRVVRALSGRGLDRIRAAAEGGDPRAMFNMGRVYDLGYGVPRNERQALEWYRRAAAKGYPQAQEALLDRGLGWEVERPPATTVPATPAPAAPPVTIAPLPEVPPIGGAPATGAPSAPSATIAPLPEVPPIGETPAPEAPPATTAPLPEVPPIAETPAPEAPPIAGVSAPPGETPSGTQGDEALPDLPDLPDLPALED